MKKNIPRHIPAIVSGLMLNETLITTKSTAAFGTRLVLRIAKAGTSEAKRLPRAVPRIPPIRTKAIKKPKFPFPNTTVKYSTSAFFVNTNKWNRYKISLIADMVIPIVLTRKFSFYQL